MNKVFLIGNLTKDPEVRVTSTSKKVASFAIAVNEGKDQNGQEKVQYFNISAWERLAEILELYVKKGTKVAIVGSLQNRSWDKPDGTKAYATDVLARELEILSSRTPGGEGSAPASQPSSFGTSASADTMPKAAAKKPEEKPEPAPEAPLPEINVDDLNIQMPF